MGTFKKLVGVGVITGVVMYAYLRKLTGKADLRLADNKKENPQLT